MSSTVAALRNCPDCGAEVPADAATCWLCFADLSKLSAEAPARRTPPPSASGGTRTFSLETLFLVMTLVAVCAGIVAAAPETIVLVLVLVVPALVRTLGSTRKQLRAGGEPSAAAKIGAFFSSLLLAALTWAAAAVAFYGACWAACGAATLVGAGGPYGGNALTLGFVVGGIVGVVVFGLLYWLLWPGRRRRKRRIAVQNPGPRPGIEN